MDASDDSFKHDHDEVIRQMKEILEGKVPVARQAEQKKRVKLPKGADLAVMLVNSLRNSVRETGGLDSLEEPEPKAVPAQQVAVQVLAPTMPKLEIAALPQVDIPASLSVERIATSASWPPAVKKEGAARLARLIGKIRKRKSGKGKAAGSRAVRKAVPTRKAAKKPLTAPTKRPKKHPKSRRPVKLTGRQKLLALLARRRRK